MFESLFTTPEKCDIVCVKNVDSDKANTIYAKKINNRGIAHNISMLSLKVAMSYSKVGPSCHEKDECIIWTSTICAVYLILMSLHSSSPKASPSIIPWI